MPTSTDLAVALRGSSHPEFGKFAGLRVNNGLNIFSFTPGGMPKALEKTGANVEPISHHKKRNQQNGSAKHRKLLYNFELK